MKKSGIDTKVKKTLVRNYEQRVKSTSKNVTHDVGSTSKVTSEKPAQKENTLNQPSLCSSAVVANYLVDVRKTAPPSAPLDDVNIDKNQVTKKLNFHFNDRIYKNLIELNANVELKSKKERRPSSINIKRDLEPNIEDFYCDEKEPDSPPEIPVLRPKFKPVKIVENGHLHKLVAKFDNL
ncbi:uncharacterized protein LOC115452937 [Manduca sexta]|uniref:Protein phosphatase 1 regulatory subunit 35 C-terminal domain-containing protein n=1 Tax=Manduca sexta TaxID=7130 RepID=A0A922CZA3_MANSE|nr:uncharacterized protein LOC115452937 [Manduca sexta]KAG6464254.1 hypothetical protein O3G_MSEX014388 [Manduca sexta]